jgi:hypothetical protein
VKLIGNPAWILQEARGKTNGGYDMSGTVEETKRGDGVGGAISIG